MAVAVVCYRTLELALLSGTLHWPVLSVPRLYVHHLPEELFLGTSEKYYAEEQAKHRL